MRNFIIIGHRAVTNENFTLNDLPGSSGRMDVLARCINSAFQLSHDIRRDVEVAIILLGPNDPPKTIRFCGSELKYLNPDERSTGALIRNALIKFSSMEQPPNENTTNDNFLLGEIKASPGIYISKNSLPEILKFYSKNSIIVNLNETGEDISKAKIENDSGNISFILSDDMDLTAEEEKLVGEHSKLKICLSPKVLHSDHCIIIIHNFLDKFE